MLAHKIKIFEYINTVTIKLFSQYQSDTIPTGQYKILGKVVAHAILTGHPGPGVFTDVVANYMLHGSTPHSPINVEKVNAEVRDALNEVHVISVL